MIKQREARCWVIGAPDADPQVHFATEADALSTAPPEPPRLLHEPCWLAECEGGCGYSLGDVEEFNELHWTSRGEAEAIWESCDGLCGGCDVPATTAPAGTTDETGHQA